jgi:hypothetical protein
LRLTSRNPAASNFRLISRKGNGLSGIDVNSDRMKLRHDSCMWRVKVQFERFPQIIDRFIFGLTLTGDIDFEALCNVPITLSPDTRGKLQFHSFLHPVSGDHRDHCTVSVSSS